MASTGLKQHTIHKQQHNALCSSSFSLTAAKNNATTSLSNLKASAINLLNNPNPAKKTSLNHQHNTTANTTIAASRQ